MVLLIIYALVNLQSHTFHPSNMSQSKPRSFLGISITILCLIAAPLQSHAADKSKTKAAHSAKERLVLMPIRVPEEDKNLTGAMETALVKGLQQKYDVFSGERVAQKAHEIFMKESRNTAHTECDETRCMQNIAEAFQAELIATANVTKQDGSYFLAISIQNIFDNKVEYSESLPCKDCDATQVVEKLKELSGAPLKDIKNAPRFSIGNCIMPIPDSGIEKILKIVSISKSTYTTFSHFLSNGKLVQAEDYGTFRIIETDNSFNKVICPKFESSFSPDKYLDEKNIILDKKSSSNSFSAISYLGITLGMSQQDVSYKLGNPFAVEENDNPNGTNLTYMANDLPNGKSIFDYINWMLNPVKIEGGNPLITVKFDATSKKVNSISCFPVNKSLTGCLTIYGIATGLSEEEVFKKLRKPQSEIFKTMPVGNAKISTYSDKSLKIIFVKKSVVGFELFKVE